MYDGGGFFAEKNLKLAVLLRLSQGLGIGLGASLSKSQYLGCTEIPKLTYFRFMSFVTLNMRGCSLDKQEIY